MSEYDSIPFQGTNYEYKVSLGTVTDKDAIGWASELRRVLDALESEGVATQLRETQPGENE